MIKELLKSCQVSDVVDWLLAITLSRYHFLAINRKMAGFTFCAKPRFGRQHTVSTQKLEAVFSGFRSAELSTHILDICRISRLLLLDTSTPPVAEPMIVLTNTHRNSGSSSAGNPPRRNATSSLTQDPPPEENSDSRSDVCNAASSVASSGQVRTSRTQGMTLSDYRDTLRRLEQKIHKAAGLELALIDRAVLLRQKRQRLMLSKEAIVEKLRKEQGGDKASS